MQSCSLEVEWIPVLHLLEVAALQVTDAHLSAYAVDPATYHIAEGLKWVIERALEPSLEDRFTISDLVGALRCVVEGRYFCGPFECYAGAPDEGAGGSESDDADWVYEA